jgi:hypothetical protein
VINVLSSLIAETVIITHRETTTPMTVILLIVIPLEVNMNCVTSDHNVGNGSIIEC